MWKIAELALGGIVKAFPFLATYVAGWQSAVARQQKIALKNQKKKEKIIKRNKQASNAKLKKKLDKARRRRD